MYVYSDRQPTRVVTIDSSNETDPYAHALSVNLSKVSLGTLSGQNASTVNQVFELTLSEHNVQRLVAFNRSLPMSISPTMTVNQTAVSHSHNGSCSANHGDPCVGTLVMSFSRSHLSGSLADIPDCAVGAAYVQITTTAAWLHRCCPTIIRSTSTQPIPIRTARQITEVRDP